MQTFLERLAQYHISYHLTELDDFCFVFPSRRACRFFAKQLGQMVDKPLWSPKIITISDFFNEIDPTPVCDNITLLFKLHASYCQIIQNNISIDDFLPLGEMLLSDFNDIDNYMVNPKELFANLAAIKRLEVDYSHLSEAQIEAIRSFWSSFDPQKLSEQQSGFLNVWEKLYELYEHFRQELQQQKEAYNGMLIMRIAEKARSGRSIDIPYKKVVFSGFNALNKCEKIVFNYLKTQNKANFFWDYPQDILREKLDPTNHALKVVHEGGLFIKANIYDYPSPDNWEQPFDNTSPDISISAASNNLVQAQVVYNFLDDISRDMSDAEVSPENFDEEELLKHNADKIALKTAVILADEQQLFPVLTSIPVQYSKINITLGYPLKSTPAYSLVENLLVMQRSTRKTKNGKTWFYHRDVLALLRHQYMQTIMGDKAQELIHQLIEYNNPFIEGSILSGSPQTAAIFKKIETTSELTGYLNELLIMIYRQLQTKGAAEKDQSENIEEDEATDDSAKGNVKALEMEFVYYLYTTIKRLSDILSKLPQQPNTLTWQSLFRKLAASQSVPFNGEPLRGLQLMGLLETRVLDFENLIIIGMNEGVFPKTSPPNSFIPFNLRKGFDLPVIDNQDAIFAYYFYRLIHRAKRIKLVYTTTKTATEEGEMSRFLQQLFYEYPGNLRIETPLQKVNVPREPEIFASKTEAVMEKLKKYREPGNSSLSPSALSHYIECSLRFYYSYIAGIKEPEAISEDLDPRVFGNLFHSIVEKIYSSFIGKTVEAADLESWLAKKDKIKEVMNSIFEESIPFIRNKSGEFSDLQGKNSLVYEILFRYIVRFLECEKQITPFKLLALEEKVRMTHRLTKNLTVNLGGTIDRTDERDGLIRIIDYKTGKSAKDFKAVPDLFSQNKHSDLKAIFQTLLYGLIKSDNTGSDNIQPGVIAVRELFMENYEINISLNKSPLRFSIVKEEFIGQLNEVLTELFDPEIPFMQTENKKNCVYCAFNKHCLRV
ncbi:MAG TPA: PD-(D/E)XK nuclease family protein [Marinilabiliaceae bacterium]|nr:PD-(D/E)XK nuclease family protein [Marinilabiliaceae bacterium]